MCAITERAKREVDALRRNMADVMVDFTKAAQILSDEGEDPRRLQIAVEALQRADNDLWLAQIAL